MTHRRGYTMIEMLIVLAVGSTLLTLAVSVVHRTMSIHTAAQRADAERRHAFRLAHALRLDLRRSLAIEVDGDTLSLTLETPAGDAATTYAWSAGAVVREQIRAGGQRARETFHFGDDAQFEVRRESDPARIVATIQRPRKEPDRPPRTVLSVEVVPGRFTTEQLQPVASEDRQ